jgi:CubicO group peptidase (beta-lactamase class C family)
LTVGVIINRVTGMSYVKYVQQEIFNPAGLSNAGVIGQDWFEYGRSDGSVRLRLDDWIRLAVWVRESQEKDDCFGKYLQAASQTQIKNVSKKSGQSFDGYGFFIWTENVYAKDSFWAVGHGGQRIGWNNRNKRIILAFSNHETYMVDLYKLYDEWVNLD